MCDTDEAKARPSDAKRLAPLALPAPLGHPGPLWPGELSRNLCLWLTCACRSPLQAGSSPASEQNLISIAEPHRQLVSMLAWPQ